MSSYVAKDGEVIVSACDHYILAVRPIGSPGTTAGRYPPRVGDLPEGFRLEYDLGEGSDQLKVNVSARIVVAGNGKDYMRWTGDMVGKVTESESRRPQETGGGPEKEMRERVEQSCSSLVGVAVLEQFVMVE